MAMGIVLSTVSLVLFLLYQVTGIYVGDSGDLVTAAAVHGVPHPPGYPLYTLLGFLATKLPWFTPSWKVALVSSVPHALVLLVLFVFVHSLTKNKLAAAFSVVVLLANYIFFLYAITPEVFALFDLFVISLLYGGYLLFRTKQTGRIPLWIGLFGLSLSHHHVVLFLVPAFLYIVWQSVRNKKITHIGKTIVQSAVLFCAGLLPYWYIPVVASTDPIINWDRVVDLQSFVRLITRADYGSFVSGGSIGNTMYERFLSLKAYGQFVWTDWTAIGIGLVLFGAYMLYRRERTLFWYFALALIGIGPFFFFYASFPLVNRFLLGTYERFLLPNYLIFSLLCGVAFHGLFSLRLSQKLRALLYEQPLVRFLAIGLLFLYPFTMLGISLWRFTGFSTDRTADNLGRDVLASAPPKAIVLVSTDTVLFTTQYVRYALNVRPDTVVIHASRLSFPDYRTTLKKQFPSLVFPKETGEQYVKTFILANITGNTIMANNIYNIGKGWFWVPHGLLYEVVAADQAPSIQATYDANQTLFASYHDPKQGILQRYPHLMSEDILDTYAYAHMNLGNALVRARRLPEAQKEYERAAAYRGDTSSETAWTKKGATESLLGLCDAAMRSFDEAEKITYADKAELLLYRSVTERDCYHDSTAAAQLEAQYQRLGKTRETPLR